MLDLNVADWRIQRITRTIRTPWAGQQALAIDKQLWLLSTAFQLPEPGLEVVAGIAPEHLRGNSGMRAECLNQGLQVVIQQMSKALEGRFRRRQRLTTTRQFERQRQALIIDDDGQLFEPQRHALIQ